MTTSSKIHDTIIGLAVGDALGVPVEFILRQVLDKNPVTNMMEYGSHQQPKGTWSDDSALTFCLMESLCSQYDLHDMAKRFVDWKKNGYWTPYGTVFDIGIATAAAIEELAIGQIPYYAGGFSEYSNGNGSLMRIIPLVFYNQNFDIDTRFKIVKEVSSLTHAHIRSIFACFIYTEYALLLLNGMEKMAAFEKLQQTINQFWKERECIIDESEIDKFHAILCNQRGDYIIKPIYQFSRAEVNSGGYVIDTLEAAFWSFLTTDTFEEAVLTAVNLGSDTDTTGCVTGALAGLYYGFERIPQNWVNALARKDDIIDLCDRFSKSINNKQNYNIYLDIINLQK